MPTVTTLDNMSETRLVKIENILENQIPSFISQESPLFREFLTQYYISQEHSTGVLDLISNLDSFKNIETYTKDVFYTNNPDNKCYLTETLYPFSDTIDVNSTKGFPDKYGLLKINNEIITYKSKTETRFEECSRGFSGITDITDVPSTASLVFSVSTDETHSTKSIVENLNLIFYLKLFEKFKSHYLPDFEKREFSPNVNLELFLSRARDFYSSKGSDISYKILFELLYNDNITVFKPQEYIIRPSLNNQLVTKNILVELIQNNIEPGALTDLIGLTLYQDISENVTASASIHNIEYRPIDDLDLFEISLDSESFVYDFVSTKKTVITEKVDSGFFVDSSVGFPESGELYAKIKSNESNGSNEYALLKYGKKSINKFSDITEIDDITLDLIKSGDELIENKLARVFLDDENTLEFRILNTIQSFDYENTNTAKVNDVINVSSFGKNFSNFIEYNSWLYNYPTYHYVKTYDAGTITFYNAIKFKINEELDVISSTGEITKTRVSQIIDLNRIKVNNSLLVDVQLIRKNITKSELNNLESAYVQNVYHDTDRDSVVVAASGLPSYVNEINLNLFKFKLVGIGDLFSTNDLVNTNQKHKHNLLSGTRVYFNSENSEISSGEYFIKKIDDTTITLYNSIEKLCLSFIDPLSYPAIKLNNNESTKVIGMMTIITYYNITEGFANQLLLKEFTVKNTLKENKIIADNQINNIEDAYNAYKS